MKLDILVFAAHPDDAELGCGGTILKHVAEGRKVGVVDLTRGELGTRGTPETREKEAADSAKILGLSVRENLGLPDGFFRNEREHQLEVVKAIRKYQPEIILANARYDRHPDHGRASELVFEATFLAGLAKVTTKVEGKEQPIWRTKNLYHYIQSQSINPDFVVDVSSFWDKKMDSIRAFKTQFYDPKSNEPDTYISSPAFMQMLESRGHEFGHAIGVKYGEGFTVRRFIGVESLFDLR
jgi:bacillithiol biosynthesis deacetylase BshB1